MTNIKRNIRNYRLLNKKTPLTPHEILDLCNTLVKIFDYTRILKQKNTIAKYIQNPKLPPRLAESIVVHLVRSNKIVPELVGFEAAFGGRDADVLVSADSVVKRIEVKSTANKEFQYLGPKDIVSDYLVWVNFGEAFLKNNFSNLTAFIVNNPKHYFSKPIRITLKKFTEITNANLHVINFDLVRL